MKLGPTRRFIRAAIPAGLFLAITWLAAAQPAAQSVAVKETTWMVERALQRLPYYGVFDFLAFGVDRGVVTLQGYAIHIIVQNGRTTLMGVVDNESDKTVAGLRAREVDGVFGVENELVVSKE